MQLLPYDCEFAYPNPDPSLRGMPESLTPLAYTPCLDRMTEAQRVTYTRLQSMFLLEQIVFFEQMLAVPALRGLLGDRELPESLRAGLADFLREENEHSALFSELLRRCDPGAYAGGRFRFVRLSAPARWVWSLVATRPKRFPFTVLMMQMQEERALHLGAVILKQAEHLDPAFVAVHRRHLADEAGHVRWDDELLRELTARRDSRWMRWNVLLLARLMDAFFIAPARGSVRVVDALIQAHPELASRRGELRSALAGLKKDRRWRMDSQSRDITPRTFGWFDRLPKPANLTQVFPGYTPGRP